MEHFLETWGYLAIFALSFISSMGLPVGAELAIIYGGVLASGQIPHEPHHLDLAVVIVVAAAAEILGSLAGYLIGRFGGRPLVDRFGRYVLLTHKDLDRAEAWFDRHGEPVVLFGRFIPLLRSFVSFVAGLAEMSIGKFVVFTAIGCTIWCSVQASVGYGLGALVVTPIIVWLGLRGGLLLVVPALAVAALLLASTRYLLSFVPEGESAVGSRAGENDLRSLAVLLTVITFRSLAWFGLITFVPLYEVSLGHSESYGNYVFAGMLLVGAIGTLAAGPLADRLGLRTVLRGSFVISTPLILVFLLVGGIPGAIALAGVGAAIVGTFGVTMVMAQQYLPRNIGMASGLAVGFAIGLGGVAAVVLGAIADSIDLRTSLFVSAAAPLVALALTALLPPTGASRRLEPEVAVL